MLPVLFTLHVPAGWGLPLAVLAVVIVGVGRALAWARGEPTGRWAAFRDALRADAWILFILGVAVVALYRAGVLRGPLELPLSSYGALLVAGFAFGMVLAQREARRRGQDAHAVADLVFWLIVAGIVGSQVFYVLLNREEFSGARFWGETPFGAWPRFLIVWRVGLVFYGGVIFAGLAAVLFLRARKLPFLAYADTLVPSLAFGHFLGRLGCFCAGCCWGRPAGDGLPWAVRFPEGSAVFHAFATDRRYGAGYLALDHVHTTLLHPSQLYEAFGELALFLTLVLLVRPRKRFHGQVLACWLVAYAVLRAVVESFRGDLQRTTVGPFNVGGWTSVAILAVGALVWALAPRTRPEPPGGGSATVSV